MRIGSAILRRRDPENYRLIEWDKQMGNSYPEVEAQVSRSLRDCFTFACIDVDNKHERLRLESGLIALLAQNPIGKPTPDWLGYSCGNSTICSFGLWNSMSVDDIALSSDHIARIKALISSKKSMTSG